MTIRRIVVGLDGSRGSELAAGFTADLAAALGADVVAVHSMGMLEDRGDGTKVPAETVRGETAVVLETEWCQPLRDAGVAFHAEIVAGNPVTVLLDVADREAADLVVVGSRGIGGISGLHLGSTSHEVAVRSPRPVVIVPDDTARKGDVRG
ncbi:MAG TPA: universal stress protein [Acidimicrobiales bacterium]|nr:universal stress protein [Acidimicrobiales bacterium]